MRLALAVMLTLAASEAMATPVLGYPGGGYHATRGVLTRRVIHLGPDLGSPEGAAQIHLKKMSRGSPSQRNGAGMVELRVGERALCLVQGDITAQKLDALVTAAGIRLRPILMSTMTSLFGMLPLLLIPGPGSEVYQGLAAVIVGGMSVSTMFTLIFLPSLLRLGEAKVASDRATDPAVTPSPVRP